MELQQLITLHAARVTLHCAIADISFNDLIYNLEKQRNISRHTVKRKVNLCLSESKKLQSLVASIPKEVGVEAEKRDGKEFAEMVEESIYCDHDFFYSLIQALEFHVGDDERKRKKLMNMIKKI